MNRQETLNNAMAIVHGKRETEYGSPEDSFGTIAQLWGAYLGHEIVSHDVAALMVLLKVARLRNDPLHEDSWIDVAGYAACGAECAQHSLTAPYPDTTPSEVDQA